MRAPWFAFYPDCNCLPSSFVVVLVGNVYPTLQAVWSATLPKLRRDAQHRADPDGPLSEREMRDAFDAHVAALLRKAAEVGEREREWEREGGLVVSYSVRLVTRTVLTGVYFRFSF